jgi:hypothetical protein
MQLVKYFVIVLTAVLSLTASVTWLANKGLRQSNVDFYGRINSAAKSQDQTNLLLIGSSRVLKHLDPGVIDSVCHTNTYNYGLNAGTIKTWYNIIRYNLFFRKNIKAIVLNVDHGMFDITKDPYKDAYYYPFQGANAGMLMTDSGTGRLVHKIKIFDIALYDDYAKYAAIDGLLRPGRTIEGMHKGYFPDRQPGHFEPNPVEPEASIKTAIVATKEGFALLDSCINICAENKVQLVLLVAPYLKKYGPEKYYNNFAQILDTVKIIATRNSIPFYDFRNMEWAGNEQYFYNANHLNSKGAALYTLAVADSIKKYF